MFIRRLAATDEPAARLLVDSLVLRAPSGADAEVCAVKSFLAYLAGDGVIARAAPECVLCSQPKRLLAARLLAAVEHGISPKYVHSLLTM
jgi:hypothetical protein